jgi:hypothetical protein
MAEVTPPHGQWKSPHPMGIGYLIEALKEVVDTADFVYRLIPTSDEIAWALLRMRQRGWLAVQGNLYGLTAEGRRAIGEIVGEGSVLDRFERLEAWTLAHPPPGDE